MTSDFECWENEETELRTEIPLQSSGDLGVYQTKLVGFEPTGRIVAHYDYRPTFLLHLMIFHLQNGMQIPNRKDWNQVFFNGEYSPEIDRSRSFDLFKIKRHAETGNLLQIITERAFESFDEASDDPIPPIPQSYDPNVQLWPVIDETGKLVYIETTSEKKEIILAGSDVSQAFEVTRAHMLSNNRGQRSLVGRVYSEFPFEAYEQSK